MVVDSAGKSTEQYRNGINAKKHLCEGVIAPTALYDAEVWGMRRVEVFEMFHGKV